MTDDDERRADALDDAQCIIDNCVAQMPLWSIAEEVACRTRLTKDEAEEALWDVLRGWVADRLMEARNG